MNPLGRSSAAPGGGYPQYTARISTLPPQVPAIAAEPPGPHDAQRAGRIASRAPETPPPLELWTGGSGAVVGGERAACGKRLQELLPLLVESLESDGHHHPGASRTESLLAMSSAAIDRLFAPIRKESAGNGWRRPPRPTGARCPNARAPLPRLPVPAGICGLRNERASGLGVAGVT